MNSGSVITTFGQLKLKRGDVIKLNGKMFKVLAVKSETTLTIGPLKWWQRAGYRAIWFMRSRWQRAYWRIAGSGFVRRVLEGLNEFGRRLSKACQGGFQRGGK